MLALNEVSKCLFQIKLLDHQIGKRFEEATGFSLTRYEMLQVLKDLAPCLQTTIQQKVLIDQAAITRHLKLLEEKGYVTRNRNPENQREVFVDLTDKAREALVNCETKAETIEEIIGSFFTATDIRALNELLQKFSSSMSEQKENG